MLSSCVAKRGVGCRAVPLQTAQFLHRPSYFSRAVAFPPQHHDVLDLEASLGAADAKVGDREQGGLLVIAAWLLNETLTFAVGFKGAVRAGALRFSFTVAVMPTRA